LPNTKATLSDQTAKALTAALEIGSDVDVLVAGKGAADAAAKLKGVARYCSPRPANWNSIWPSRWRPSACPRD